MAYSNTGGIEIVWASKADAFTLSHKVKPRQLKKVPKLCFGDVCHPSGYTDPVVVG